MLAGFFSDPLNLATTAGMGVLGIGRYGFNPKKLMADPLVSAAWAGNPKARIQGYQASKNYILGKAAGADMTTQEALFEKERKKKCASLRCPIGHAKTAGIPGILGSAMGFFGRHPVLTSALTVGGAAGAIMGADYLAEQARTIQRARAYRDMQRQYGRELSHEATKDTGTNGPQFTPEQIEQAFNALHKTAPNVARDPALAAGALQQVIHQSRMNVNDMPEGYRPLITPSVYANLAHDLQREQPRRPSDYISAASSALTATTNLGKVLGARLLAREQAAGGVHGRYDMRGAEAVMNQQEAWDKARADLWKAQQQAQLQDYYNAEQSQAIDQSGRPQPRQPAPTPYHLHNAQPPTWYRP